MKLSAAQQQISDDDHRFRVVVAGRRFGKSYLAINEMAKFARWPGANVWYVSPSYRMCRQIIMEPLRQAMLDVRWISKVNESDLTFTLINGSRISLKSADNPDSLRGSSLNFVVMDEFAFIHQRVWTESLRPALSDRQGSALFITTPVGINNWSYDLYQRGRNSDENWQSFQFTTLQGGYVTESEIAQARLDLDARTFQQEYMATFETYGNRVYYAFDRQHNIRAFTEAIPNTIYVGMDFNVGQMSAVLFDRRDTHIHAFDEISLTSSNTQEMCDEIRHRYPGHRIIVYPDPAANQRKTSASGATDISILKNAGFTVRVPHAHHAIRDGVNAVNSLLCSADGQRRFFIDARCKKTIESLDKHAYKQDSHQPDKTSGYDHFSDALRYYIDYDFPVKTQPRNTNPTTQRWAHQIS